MLQSIRDNAKGWIAWVIVILISIPFALWGVHEYVNPTQEPIVAKVNDVDLLEHDFQRNVSQQKRQYRAMMQNPSMDLSFMDAQIRDNVLQQMIEDELLVQTAVEQGMQIGDSLLAVRIHEINAFHQDGQFSQTLYEQLLNNQGMTPAYFEQEMRRDVLMRQMQESVYLHGVLTPQQQQLQQQLDNQTRQISYAVIPAERFKADIEISDAEIEAHYADNSDLYMTPEQVAIEYVELKGQDLAAELSIDESTLEESYQSRIAQFSTPVEWQARHILLETPPDADDTAVAAVETQAREVLAQLAAGEDFAELAKQVSADSGSATQGGDLGWFGEGMMVTPFEDALRNLEVGQRSDLVKTRFGFHIIELTDIKPATTQPFAEVREQLLTMLQEEQSESLFYSQAEQFANLAFEHPDSLAILADSLKLEVQSTELFDRNGMGDNGLAAEVLSSRQVVSAAFNPNVLQDGYNSEVLEVGNQHAVTVRVKQHMPPQPKPLEAVKDEIITQLTQDKAEAQAKALGEELLTGFTQAESNPTTLLEQQQLSWSAAEWLERNGAGFTYREIANEVFKLAHPPTEQAVYQGMALNNGDYALVVLLAVKTEPAPVTEDESQPSLQMALGETEYQEFIASLKASADITIALNDNAPTPF